MNFAQIPSSVVVLFVISAALNYKQHDIASKSVTHLGTDDPQIIEEI